MNGTAVFLIALIACTVILVILSSQNESQTEPKLTEKIIKEKEEQEKYNAQRLVELSQIRHTNLSLTVDRDINSKDVLYGDNSDESALIDKGIQISDQYNKYSYDYSSEKISSKEYLTILKQLKTKYSTYLMEISNYSWTMDISEHKQFLAKEYQKIVQEIKDIEK
jgi:hypothetical protein